MDTNAPLPIATTPNILEVIRTLRPQLRRSDRKVADLVLADPGRVLNANVAATAELASVSQPTVIRFCVAIGCESYQEFKLKLAQSLALGVPATHSEILDTDPLDRVVGKIFDYTLTSLDWARHHLDMQALGDAVALLESANRIEFFGFGASGIVARDAQQKFPLFGVPCGAQVDSHQQLMVACLLKPGDVAVAISNTGTTASIIEIARVARECGAKVIGITGGDAPLLLHCDVGLVVETLENTNIYTPTISRIAALVVVDVLSTAVALRRSEGHMAKLTWMKQHLSHLRKVERF